MNFHMVVTTQLGLTVREGLWKRFHLMSQKQGHKPTLCIALVPAIHARSNLHVHLVVSHAFNTIVPDDLNTILKFIQRGF